MKADKTVDVIVNYKGIDVNRKVGIEERAVNELVEGQWTPTGETEVVFGYCDDLGYMTHMCYSLRHFPGTEGWEDFAVTSRHARKHDEFYFDAGGNGRPLYIMYDEMRRAMVELGLISKAAINICHSCDHPELMHGERGECNHITEDTSELEVNCTCAAFKDLVESVEK